MEQANRLIQNHDDHIHGMIATDVDQKNGVLVFKGEYFLDDNGLPTLKITAVFNMFKHLTHELSEKYQLSGMTLYAPRTGLNVSNERMAAPLPPTHQ